MKSNKSNLFYDLHGYKCLLFLKAYYLVSVKIRTLFLPCLTTQEVKLVQCTSFLLHFLQFVRNKFVQIVTIIFNMFKTFKAKSLTYVLKFTYVNIVKYVNFCILQVILTWLKLMKVPLMNGVWNSEAPGGHK